MRYKLIFPAITVVFAYACNVLQPGAADQGISGYVYLRTGNQMPSFDRMPGKGRGVSREVYFYQPTTFSGVSGSSPMFDEVKTKLILQVRSDTTGAFMAELPVGDYSIFVKEGGKFFGAISNGDGVINPVKVFKNSITKHDLTITTKAAF